MRRISPLLALPLSLVFAVGCSSPEYEAEQARKAQTAVDQEQADLHRHHDPGRLIKETIEKLNLRPDQRVAVDRVHQTILGKMVAASGEHTALIEALAKTVGSGFVNQSELDPALRRIVRSMATMKPMFMNALNELHRTLDTEQRARLVQLLEEHHAKHQQKMGCGHRGRFFKRFGKKLGLSEQQREQIHQLAMAGLTPEERAHMRQIHEQRWQRHKAALEAFKAESFDAAKLPIFNEPQNERMHVERMVRLLKVALPVLSPEQRTQLAEHLQQGAKLFVSRLKTDALK